MLFLRLSSLLHPLLYLIYVFLVCYVQIPIYLPVVPCVTVAAHLASYMSFSILIYLPTHAEISTGAPYKSMATLLAKPQILAQIISFAMPIWSPMYDYP